MAVYALGPPRDTRRTGRSRNLSPSVTRDRRTSGIDRRAFRVMRFMSFAYNIIQNYYIAEWRVADSSGTFVPAMPNRLA